MFLSNRAARRTDQQTYIRRWLVDVINRSKDQIQTSRLAEANRLK